MLPRPQEANFSNPRWAKIRPPTRTVEFLDRFVVFSRFIDTTNLYNDESAASSLHQSGVVRLHKWNR